MGRKAGNVNTTQVTITLPNDVFERLNEESEEIGINRSAYMTMVLKEKWRNQMAIDSMPEMIGLFKKAIAMQAKGEEINNSSLTDKKSARLKP